MGNVLSYFSSMLGSKSREAPSDGGQLTGTQVEKAPSVPQTPIEVDEIAVGLKSTLISSREEWDKVIETAKEEPAEILVLTTYLQLRAYTTSPGPDVTPSSGSDGYLCVREDGKVCFDGKENAFNTIFKVSRVYPPPIDKHQFVCAGGPSKSFVLYPEGTGLKSKRFDAEKDYVCKDTAEPTLFTVEIHDDGEFLITMESREGAVSGIDSQPIKFIPHLAEDFERELAPL